MTDRVKHTWNNIKDVLLNEQTEILKVAGLLMIPTILTKLTGQLFNLLAAAQLGTDSTALNEFLLASAFPEMIANILLLGVISAVVIPIFVNVKEKHGREQFLRVYNTVINVSLIAFAIVTALIILYADKLFPFVLDYIIRPNDYPSVESIANIVNMMKVMMLPMFILGISVFITSGLNVYQRFLVPQLAPLFYNVGRIFGVFILIPVLDKSPWALVIGGIIGAVLHLLIQVPLARYVRLEYQPVIDFHNEDSRRLFRVALPRAFALASEQIGMTLVDFISSGLSKIALPAMFYANSLAVIVPTLFGYTFAVASFPSLSSLYAQKDYFRVNEMIVKTVNQIIFLSVPAVVAMMVLRLPIVRLTYGLIPGTEFGRESTAVVAWVLLFFSFGLVFCAAKWYLFRVFYVAHNTVTPLLISIFALISSVVLSVLLSNLFSHSDLFSISHLNLSLDNLFSRGEGRAAVGGVSFALSITYIMEFVMLLFLINKLVVKLNWREFFGGIARKTIPTIAMATVMFLMYKMWDRFALPIDAVPGFSGSTTLNLFVLTMITLLTSFMVYYLLCFLFQVEELKILRRFLNPVFRIGGLSIK